jgi:hypothetical protein
LSNRVLPGKSYFENLHGFLDSILGQALSANTVNYKLIVESEVANMYHKL